MSCPLKPSCHGRSWCAKSAAPANVEAFKADVVVYMQLTGTRSVGKACAAVVKAALKRGECLFA